MEFLTMLALVANAKATILCGTKDAGTLKDKNGANAFTFTAQQLDDANEKMKGGLQEGVHYCVNVKLGADGKPEKVLKITRQHK